MMSQQKNADTKSDAILTYHQSDQRNGITSYVATLSGFGVGVMAGVLINGAIHRPWFLRGYPFDTVALFIIAFLVIFTLLAVVLAACPLYLLHKFRKNGQFASYKLAMVSGFFYPLGLSLAGWINLTELGRDNLKLLIFACWICWLFLYPLFATLWLYRNNAAKH